MTHYGLCILDLCPPRPKVYILFVPTKRVKGSLIQTVGFLQKLEEAGADLHLGVVWSCKMSDVMKPAELEPVGLEAVDYNQGVEPEQTDFQLAEEMEAAYFQVGVEYNQVQALEFQLWVLSEELELQLWVLSEELELQLWVLSEELEFQLWVLSDHEELEFQFHVELETKGLHLRMVVEGTQETSQLDHLLVCVFFASFFLSPGPSLRSFGYPHC